MQSILCNKQEDIYKLLWGSTEIVYEKAMYKL